MENKGFGAAVKELREKNGMTQACLAEKLGVGSKAVSRWETGRGYPDITIIGNLASALGVSVSDLMNGVYRSNGNVSGNMMKSSVYVCPVCGNIIHSCGEMSVSCCGLDLYAEEAGKPDASHPVRLEKVEDEVFVTVDHSMTKDHYISFLALAAGDRFDLVKLYPEGNAEARFRPRGRGYIYYYCNRHGLKRLLFSKKDIG